MTTDDSHLRTPSRLRALREADLTGTAPEEAYDRLTRLTARLLGAPLALINAVGADRQFSRSCVAPPTWSREHGVDLADSFCVHAVRSRKPLVVEDARTHPMVASSRFVTELGIRAYAGIPLITAAGHALGTLCVADWEPRCWSAGDIQALDEIAAVVSTEIELRLERAETQRVADALEASHELLHGIIDALPDAVVLLDPEGMLRWTNSAVERILGYSPTELRGQALLDLVHPDDRERVEAMIPTSGPGSKTDLRVRFRFRDKEGVSIVLEARGCSLNELDECGTVLVVRDVTEQQRLEQVMRDTFAELEQRVEERTAELAHSNLELRMALGFLRESEERFRLVVDGITGYGISMLDPSGRILTWNAGAAQATGFPAEEAIGRPMSLTYRPEDVEAGVPERVLVEARERGKSVSEGWRVRRDGTLHFDQEIVTPLHMDKRLVGFAKIWKDITEDREKARRRTQDILESITDPFFVFDEEERFAFANKAAELMFRRPLRELIGRSYLEVLPAGRDMEMYRAVRAAVETGRAQEVEVVWGDQPGEWFLCRAYPMASGVAVYAKDVTERKQKNEELWSAKQEAERANRAKSEFLSRMSHELRTPLNAILGFGQLLELDVAGAEDRESVEQILRAARHLLALIDEVLDLARIEAEPVRLSVEPVPVGEVVGQSVDLVRLAAAKQGISLHVQGAGESEPYVRADQQRLKQVLLNLLSNAIKYNRREGEVTLYLQEVEEERLRIVVQDTGFGLSSDQMERLFTPFDRLGAEKAGVEGTGLGLALSRGLMQAMGGRLGFESKVGEGSRFWVELPLADAPEVPAEIATEPPVHGPADPTEPAGTILLIEDNLANVRLIEHLLRHRPQVRLFTAMQGRRGLELVREKRPDLVLLDLNLPDLGGDEVLLALRRDPDLRGIPVVMVSGDASVRQAERLLELGARRYVTKPFDIRQLLDIVDEILLAR